MARPRGIPNRNYPSLRLEQARRVAEVMHDQASGMTVGRLTLAELLKTTPGSSVFKERVASSRFYGLTDGGINAEEFSVTELGERLNSPDEAVKIAALKEAVLRVPPFRAFFEAFSNRKVPGMAAFREFLTKNADVDEAHVEFCIAHILGDADEAGLTRTINGSVYVDLDGVPALRSGEDEEGEDDLAAEETNSGLAAAIAAERQNGAVAPAEPQTPPPAEDEAKRPQAIFVAGRKGKSLDQLVKILDEYKIPHKLAEDEPNRARPILTRIVVPTQSATAARSWLAMPKSGHSELMPPSGSTTPW